MDAVIPFRTLSAKEEAEFRAWARATYQPVGAISPVWHPVVQDECRLMDGEVASQFARTYHIGAADALIAAAYLRDSAKGLRWNADFPDNPKAHEQRDTAEVLERVAAALEPA